MPRNELDQPCLAARGTIATDMTTRSALQRHITQAIKATTLNLSGTAAATSPTSILLSIPSAAHLAGEAALLAAGAHRPSHLRGPRWSLRSNPRRVLLKFVEFRWVGLENEDGGEIETDLERAIAVLVPMEFRPRDYSAEEEAHALPRSRVDTHPLSSPSPSHHHQVAIVKHGNSDIFDPLRGLDSNAVVPVEDLQDVDVTSTSGLSSGSAIQLPGKEWASFKKFLMQRFPVVKTVTISSMSDVIVKSAKAYEKSSTSMHLEELDDPKQFAEEGARVITRQEYISRLHELKDEITRAWQVDDRVTSLKLSIKVARLLMDTSVLQFYPTLFVLITDVLDMLGDLVWERIKQKAEIVEHGTSLRFLQDNFGASDICLDAKETCYNWFCKIGSIQQLLPRIYLELALLPCWRFLNDRPVDSLKRLVMMARGLADPLASAYCRLYMVRCASKLPSCDLGYLITCTNDIKILLSPIVSEGVKDGQFPNSKKLLVSLMEPTIEYIMKFIFKDASQRQVNSILVDLGLGRNESELFGNFPCISIILHLLLNELPIEVISSNAMGVLHLIECNNDYSFDQCLNYRLLGFRLCEGRLQMDMVNAVMDRVLQVVTTYDCLDGFLKVVDAYMDLVLQNQMENHIDSILEGISKRLCNNVISDDELTILQSILVKLLAHIKVLESVFSLNHFLEILDVMYGSSRSIVNMKILDMATRNGHICDPRTIQLLFEISQSLHDGMDYVNDDNHRRARLISRFVHMVDYGAEMERHLTFLVECRGALGGINELQETLVHSSNCLAIKASKDAKRQIGFQKSCIAFSEVTIPAISAPMRRLNLYIETAEVALLSGLVPHSDGLVDSALCCLQSLDLKDGSRTLVDIDGLISSIRKLCSFLVIVPGNPKQVNRIPNTILSLLNSQSWMTPRLWTRILCAILSLSATLSQNKLPYHVPHTEILGNDILFFDDLSYLYELLSSSELVLQKLIDTILQEPTRAGRGSLALEACNCIASSFKLNHEISLVCSKLIETAKSCLSTNDKYLQSTIKYLEKYQPSSHGMATSIAV